MDFSALREIFVTWGLEHKLLMLFLMLSVLDAITGTSAAAVQRRLSSKVSWAGANRKFLTYCAVLLAVVMDELGSGFTGGLPLAAPVITFYTWREFLSVIENLTAAGVPIPPPLSHLADRLADTQTVPPEQPKRGPAV